MIRKTTITMSEKEWHKILLGAYTGNFPKLLALKFKIIELIHSLGVSNEKEI